MPIQSSGVPVQGVVALSRSQNRDQRHLDYELYINGVNSITFAFNLP